MEIPILLGGVKERRRRLVGHADGRAWASEVTDKGEKPLSKREDVMRMERSDASTEEDDASFQEKLLAKRTRTRTENGHTWERRES